MFISIKCVTAKNKRWTMSDSKQKNQAVETVACCCVDVGTVIDNSDCTASYEAVLPNEQAAQEVLLELTKQAERVSSEPCQINSQIEKVAEGCRLTADFTFSCQAETMIFQLALR